MRHSRQFAMALMAALFLTGLRAMAEAAFHVAIVTGTVAQNEDDPRGAEALIKLYGSVRNGGMILHQIYPDDFMSQQETFISNVASLADDSKMKAIIVNQAIPGTAEAFRRVRAKRRDILLFAGESHEDLPVISAAADYVVNNDFLSRGYTVIWAARKMGAKTFVHISFPRHMSYETMSRRRATMEAACKDLGLKFVFETAPDPTSEVGVPGAQQFILEQVPTWLRKYGPRGERVAFFSTNDAHTEPLLKQLLASRNGVFVEADLPSPIMGYPGALGLDLASQAGNFPAILQKVERGVVGKGGAGRFGTWAFSYGFTTSAGLGEYAIRIIQGTARRNNAQDLFKAYGKFTPGAKWSGTMYTDAGTGVRSRNVALVFMDLYVFGGVDGVKDNPFLRTTSVAVPRRYTTPAPAFDKTGK